jgi:hypothetical protein
MGQSQSNDEGVGEGLANRVAQSAAVAADREKDAAPPITGTPAKTTPQDLVTDRPKTIKGEKRIPSGELQKMTKKLGSAPVFDKGGKVNVEDGKHQFAIVKDGERVLTEKQNAAYEKSRGVDGKAPTKLPIGGKTQRDANDVTPEIKPTLKAPLFDKGGMVEHTSEEKAQFHRAMSHLNTGGLHRHFGIPEGQPIPMAKKQEAANSDDPHVSKMGHLAVAMHGWKHGKK